MSRLRFQPPCRWRFHPEPEDKAWPCLTASGWWFEAICFFFFKFTIIPRRIEHKKHVKKQATSHLLTFILKHNVHPCAESYPTLCRASRKLSTSVGSAALTKKSFAAETEMWKDNDGIQRAKIVTETDKHVVFYRCLQLFTVYNLILGWSLVARSPHGDAATVVTIEPFKGGLGTARSAPRIPPASVERGPKLFVNLCNPKKMLNYIIML